MINIIPSKHLLMIALVSAVILIILIVLPSDSEESPHTISLEAVFQKPSQPEPNQSRRLPASLPNNTDSNDNNSNNNNSNDNSSNTKPLTPVLKTVTIKSGDSLSSVLSKHGISAQDIYKVSQADKKQKDLLRMRPDQTINFAIDPKSGLLSQLTLTKNALNHVRFERDEDTFNRKNITRKPEITKTYKEATINNSLFVSGLQAGIDEPLLIEMANIFGWDIDFALDIRKGDRFSLLYEDKYLDGERIGHGNIIAAQFINNGRVFQAIRYETKKGAHYYTPDGLAMRKAFLRTPVDFTRISSVFNPNRLHPIFKTSRPHRGVDYAAAKGTPVKAAGDGRVSFVGKQRGYGNVVIINHGKGYTTLYAHLNGFARNLKRGKKVIQGNIIAYVGQTGWATGPHLHYEFRINGKHKNPVTVKLPNDDPMPKADLKNYLPYAQKIAARLANSHSASFADQLALYNDET